MDNSADATNLEASSAAAEYGGYSPRHVNDFPVRDDSLPPTGEENETAPFLNPRLSKRKPLDHLLSLAAFVICLVLFIIFLVGGTVAPCKFGLCGMLDLSSLLFQTTYDIEVYDFEAPLKFIWGAFTVFTLVCALFSLYSFVLCKKELDSETMSGVAAYIRRAALLFLVKEFVLLFVVLVGLFILIGVGYSMRAAGCLVFGATTAIFTCITTAMVSTSGNVRAATLAGQSRSQQMTLELRTGTIITVASYAFAIGGPAFSYMVLRDVRALTGYVIGAVTVALFVRISGGIFHKAGNISRDPTAKGPSIYGRARDNPTIFATNVGTIVGKAIGESMQAFIAFTVAVVATSILASSFPYFGNNRYALCVFNHLEVDHTCTGFREPRKKLSFAASICRANGFYNSYLQLSTWASNSSFIAMPFILGFTGVLVTLIVTAYRSTPPNADVTRGNEELEQEMKPFVNRIRINIAMAAVLTLICGAAVSFGLFGNNSSFYKENTVERDVYIIPALTPENADTRCRPLETPGDNLPNVPSLELVKQPYRTRNSFGEVFPQASETGWRLFICVLLGVILGLGLGFFYEWVASVSRYLPHLVAENGELGASAVLVEGLGVSFVSTFGSFVVVLTLVLGCYALHGAYGIGVSALSMLSIAGPMCVISLFDTISSSAKGINSTMIRRDDDTATKTDAFETVGKKFSTMWKGVVNTGLTIAMVAMLFVVILETNLIPSSLQLGGTAEIRPSMHVSDVDHISAIDIYTLASMMIGLLTPLVLCATLMLGMSRTWQIVVWNARNLAETQRDYDDCIEKASFGSIVETIIPGMMAIMAALIIGFGFGQRALIGMVTGFVWASLLLSQAFCIGGGVWESASRVVASGRFGNEHSNGKWARAMTAGEGLGVALADCVGPCINLAATEVCALSVAVVGLMKKDASGWWVGLVLLIILSMATMALTRALNIRFEKLTTEGDHGVALVDRREISPFFEEGPGIIEEHINPDSEFGRQEIGQSVASSEQRAVSI